MIYSDVRDDILFYKDITAMRLSCIDTTVGVRLRVAPRLAVKPALFPSR